MIALGININKGININYKNVYLNYIVETTTNMPCPTSDISNMIIWKSFSSGKIFVKSIICTNNSQIPPHPWKKILILFENYNLFLELNYLHENQLEVNFQ